MRHRRRPYRDYLDDDPDSIGETLAAVNDRLDDLALQVARIARRTRVEDRTARHSYDEERELSAGIGRAFAQFNRRLDEIADSIPGSAQPRTQSEWTPDLERPASATSAPVEPGQDLGGLENQLRKITEQLAGLHQPCRIDDAVVALRHDLAEIGRAFSDAMPRREIEVLEKEVRALSERLDAGRNSGVDAGKFGALEHGIAEMRNALRNLEPAENLVEIGNAVKSLAHKIDQITTVNQSSTTLQKLDQLIAGLRGVLAHVASNDTVTKLAAEIRALAAKLDQAAANPAQAISGLNERVAALESGRSTADSEPLVQAIAEELDRRISPLVEASQAAAASNDTLVKALGDELDQRIYPLIEANRSAPPANEAFLKALGDEIDQRLAQRGAGHAPSADPETLIRAFAEEIDRRISAHLGAGRPVSPELSRQVAALNEKLDRLNPSQGESIALAGIENRIVALASKLDESSAWLERFNAIERGMADVLVYLDDLRRSNAQQRSADSRDESGDEPRRPSPERRQSSSPALDDRQQKQEGDPQPQHRDADVRATSALPTFDTAAVPPAQPSTPAPSESLASAFSAPEHSLAPASTAGGAEAAPVDALVAAFEPGPHSDRVAVHRPIAPDLPPDTPIEPALETSQLRAAAAERIGASEAALSGTRPVAREVASQFETLIAARRAAFAASAHAATAAATSGRTAEKSAAPEAGRLRTYLRWVLLVASIIVIVLGALKVGFDMWGSPDESPPPAVGADQPSTATDAAPPPAASPPAQGNAPAMPLPGETNPPAPDGAPSNPPVNGAVPPETLDGISDKPMPEVTGALPRDSARAAAELPATIAGPVLRAAAAAGNPAAEYEIAVRYAEGRGVTANIEESARWLERAARSGFAPALFRLGSLYDKGGGLKRDRALARQYYAAAAEQGHAKASHNLAVLYAEGIDGRPNYRAAAQWFRKAAEYGIADSQYNLAILYIRGIGTEQNLAEAYKWFALAANQGDQEAARKRDEVAERLDEQTLALARRMVQAFIVAPQPEQAVSLRVPPGGWDRASVNTQPPPQPLRPRPRPAAPDIPNTLLAPQPL